MRSLINKFVQGLQRTKTLLVRNIQSLFSDTRIWTKEDYDKLEEIFLGADLGVHITQRLLDDIRDRYERGLVHTSADIIKIAREKLLHSFKQTPFTPINHAAQGPTVILLVGVNGSGKTTTSAKLAHLFQEDGKSVILAACDTFRAAAIEQLKIWADRLKCQIVAGKYGSDPAAVAYDAISAAQSRRINVALIDTAGRQHTKKGLMDELAKIQRSIAKACPTAPHEVWLVIDGSTGTNALQQARVFKDSVKLTGICITKLDGTSKGGIAVAINEELKIPLRFIGLGEDVSDLQPFDPEFYINSILA
jgi:fused signal recognition particle receptor